MTKFDRSKISSTMHWFGLVMIAAYIGLGCYVLFTDYLNYIEKNTRIIFSFFFFAFGLFRGVHWIQKHKARKYIDESE